MRTCHFFVYGTLKRGHRLEHAWPHAPLSVQPATTFGRLFDLGDYPAMCPGHDRILGELWQFAPEHLDETLRAIDVVEDHYGGQDDLYKRVLVECRVDQTRVDAFAYIYAQPISEACRMVPRGDYCVWP